MSSSTFEVREAENESDKVIGFGLETCEENGISVSEQLDGDLPKDHTYTKEPDIVLDDDTLKPTENLEDLSAASGNNEADKPKVARAAKAQKVVAKRNIKPKTKKESSSKKDESPSKKSKTKKEALDEEDNTTEDVVGEKADDEKSSPEANNEDGNSRPKRKARKRKLEEKENVLDRSIMEEVENIVEEAAVDNSTSETPAKKKNLSSTPIETLRGKKNVKGKSSIDSDDHNLPKGWVRKTVVRKSGKTAGQFDIYIYSPDGIKFRSKPDIAAYLAKTKSPFKLEHFNFSKKKLSDAVKPVPKKEKPLPVKSKPLAQKKKATPATPTKKRHLLVKIKFPPKSKKNRLTKKSAEKQSKASKTSVKGGKASGASLKGNTLDTGELKSERSLGLGQDQNETIGMSKLVTQDTNNSADVSLLKEATVLQKKVKRKSRPSLKIASPSKKKKVDVAATSVTYNKEPISSSPQVKLKKGVKKKPIETGENVNTSIVKEVQKLSEAGSDIKKYPNIHLTDLSITISRLTESEISSTCNRNWTDVPAGWRIEKIKRKSGKTAGITDVYIYNSEGVKFRSRSALIKYLAKIKSPLHIEDFKIWSKTAAVSTKALTVKQNPNENNSSVLKNKGIITSNLESQPTSPSKLEHIAKGKMNSETTKVISVEEKSVPTEEHSVVSTDTSESKSVKDEENTVNFLPEKKELNEATEDDSLPKNDSSSRLCSPASSKSAAEMLNLPTISLSTEQVKKPTAKKITSYKMVKVKGTCSEYVESGKKITRKTNDANNVNDQSKSKRKGEERKMERKGEKRKMERKGENRKMEKKGEKQKLVRKGEKRKMERKEDKRKMGRKGEKRKVDGKENVHYKSIAEEVQNISQSITPGTESDKLQEKGETLDVIVHSFTDKKEKSSKSSTKDKTESGHLPKGWMSKVVERKSGKTAGQVDIYIFSPDGIKFRSKTEIAAYLAKTKSALKVEDFTFNKKGIVNSSRKSAAAKKVIVN